jgi:hypothetical protein
MGAPANGVKSEERFLSSRADHFPGVKWSEKVSACSVRIDGVVDGATGGGEVEVARRHELTSQRRDGRS